VIVVGAGINGAAIAREAALQGLTTLLLDRGDIGSGTSGASSRLIHGGLRYLEHGELSLVHESLQERERLLRSAPHLVQPLELNIPLYRGGRRRPWQIRIGLQLYDWLSRGNALQAHRMRSRESMLRHLPGLRSVDLVAGASYYDAQVTFPERLVVENVRDAADHGARLITYAQVTRIRVDAGRVIGVDWRTQTGADSRADASIVINAAGPWVDQVLDGIGQRRLIGGTKGSHLIVEPFPGAPAAGVYVEAGADARPLFILPWNGLYLIGTTDVRFDGDPSDARIDAGELAYLIAETERVFPAAAGLAGRVLYTHTGVRPLPHQPRADAGAITRRHLIRPHGRARGLYSIIGGKLTTHRALAEDVLRALRRHLPRLKRRSPTRDRPLPGALDAADRASLLEEVAAKLGSAHALRLWRVYGSAARSVLELSRDPALAAEDNGAAEILPAELAHAVDREWATTLVDILHRRCMTGLNADFGLNAAPAAAECLVRLGVWDRTRAEAELLDYRDYARRCRARDLTS
jgi:glycerol-3-phosphate dehydrogenase